jgi:hypothetical protein
MIMRRRRKRTMMMIMMLLMVMMTTTMVMMMTTMMMVLTMTMTMMMMLTSLPDGALPPVPLRAPPPRERVPVGNFGPMIGPVGPIGPRAGLGADDGGGRGPRGRHQLELTLRLGVELVKEKGEKGIRGLGSCEEEKRGFTLCAGKKGFRSRGGIREESDDLSVAYVGI